jgi:acetyl esterase/lipase
MDQIKKMQLLLVFVFYNCLMNAQQIIDLWDGSAPVENGLTGDEQFLSNGRICNVTKPTISIFLAKHPNGKAVVICPGGGYRLVSMGHEGINWTPWFNQLGISCIVLKYRMPNGNKDVLLQDMDKCMKIVRINARKWNIDSDKIGIMGFSAGGHLAALAANSHTLFGPFAFQILFYPVISMDKPYTHKGTYENFFGDDKSQQTTSLYSNEKIVNKLTPPAFIVACSDDSTVPPVNSIMYYSALAEQQISAELHIFKKGGHGWGFNETANKRHLLDLLSDWLKAI